MEKLEFRKVTAIVRAEVLERVERRLQELGVPGLSVTRVKGYGEYANFFARDWLVEHVRIEIFVTRQRAAEIAAAIVTAGRTGAKGDGIVAVLPVEAVYHVRTGALATPGDLGGGEGGPA
jgi:nitrogen regulatory protein P-II 1